MERAVPGTSQPLMGRRRARSDAPHLLQLPESEAAREGANDHRPRRRCSAISHSLALDSRAFPFAYGLRRGGTEPLQGTKKEPLRRAALERNRLDYLRRRKINSAAAPSPAKAMLVGSGTAITIPPGKKPPVAIGTVGGTAVGSPVAVMVKMALHPVGAP